MGECVCIIYLHIAMYKMIYVLYLCNPSMMHIYVIYMYEFFVFIYIYIHSAK
jgi:hypothetical protein